ncbi:hypothetical protein G3N59_23165 [Paraburkholderia sp. Ac-20340]|uniref:hypothetical protein n=1 Tax=Paraburkholderia sp. Ac-20340 TaxID=2703888 RepID=UPI00197E169F|nr:hypothetical protein [Paraburkholderia sp. Ac-20340]MBN3856281.1 hypothetical protein [Paraburkholderia sp. Ac-20340]
MTVDFVPARPLWCSAPRKRLSLPGVFSLALFSTFVACATSACSNRDDDTRVVLTTRAERDLAQTQPAPALSAAAQQGTSALAGAFSSPSNSPDSANGAAAITAIAVRSPARAAAVSDGASGAEGIGSTGDAPLAPPDIHTAD